jgi:hypothetical protein
MTTNETNVPAPTSTAVSTAVHLDAGRELSEAEALVWLRAQPGGRVRASDAELGATFLGVGEAAIYSLLFCGVAHRQDMRRRAMFERQCHKEARCVPVRLLAKV